MHDETIDVPAIITGDYTTRYRGPDVPEHAIRDRDVLVVDKTDGKDPATGRLVVTIVDRRMGLAEFEPGMTFAGLVVGVMRKVGDES